MKIYTKTGDEGQTYLFGGERVQKTNERVRAYGAVDEANSFIGHAAAAPGLGADIRHKLEQIMSDLFDVGAELSTRIDNTKATGELEKRLKSRVHAGRISELEQWIDEMSAKMPPMKTFVLPTGCEVAGRLHIARSASRRAEREVIALYEAGESIRPELLQYMNRLSDILFTVARFANHEYGYGDIPWHAKKD